MAGVEPGEEGEVLRQAGRVAGHGGAAGGGFQVGDRLRHQRCHGLEVADREADVGERGSQALGQMRRHVIGGRLDPHLDCRAPTGRGVDHRVEHRQDTGAGRHQLGHHAVDQERRVGLDDLDQIGAEWPAVDAGRGADADVGLGAARGLGEGPEAGRADGDIGGAHARQFVGPIVRRDGFQEPLGAGGRGLRFARQGGKERRREGGGVGAEVGLGEHAPRSLRRNCQRSMSAEPGWGLELCNGLAEKRRRWGAPGARGWRPRRGENPALRPGAGQGEGRRPGLGRSEPCICARESFNLKGQALHSSVTVVRRPPAAARQGCADRRPRRAEPQSSASRRTGPGSPSPGWSAAWTGTCR